MTLHYIEAHRLNYLLEEFKESLQQKKGEEKLEKRKAVVIKELDTIVKGLKSLKVRNLL